MKPTHTLINLEARHTHQNMSLKAVFHTLLYLVAKTSIEATWENRATGSPSANKVGGKVLQPVGQSEQRHSQNRCVHPWSQTENP